ncbi:MAG: hypothetical protein S4CHLAM123_09450 [Chlamydiales bacterium]|nr:hypothetical protein [Chlamydiales bacterium]
MYKIPNSGAFSIQFIEGMKQIFKLAPLLEVQLIRPGESQKAIRDETIEQLKLCVRLGVL